MTLDRVQLRLSWGFSGFGSLKGALPTLAIPTQVLPRVDAAGVAVEPVELESIAAHGVGARRLDGRGVHGQERCGLRLGLAGFAAFRFAFVDASGARAGIAQPGEVPTALVAISPVDLE